VPESDTDSEEVRSAVLEPGTTLYFGNGMRYPGDRKYFPPATSSAPLVTRAAKEVVSILSISGASQRVCVQWIVNGKEGPIVDCTKDFFPGKDEEKERHTNRQVFPCFSLSELGSGVTLIPITEVKFSSPRIEELLQVSLQSQVRDKDLKIRQQANQIWELQQLLEKKDAEIAALQKELSKTKE
jgi:hypothetical protein